MTPDAEIHEFLLRHLNAIYQNDIQTYHATTGDDLTLYEWWVIPHRLDGLPFHDFMMAENARRGAVFGVESRLDEGEQPRIRFDLANLNIQRYPDTAVACYTLLTSIGTPTGVQVEAHNESRIMVKIAGHWKVVHVHKSPAWPAPHLQP
jgi:hypothetical protein